MKIVVLAGGLSNERDVSLSSGSLIANALIEVGHDVALVDLYVGIHRHDDWKEAFVNRTSGKTYSYTIPTKEPDLERLKKEYDNGGSLIGKNVLDICRYADVVFLALHGSIGENGQLQAIFDAMSIRYTGTGYVGSLLAMDKDLSKKLLTMEGIPTPKWRMVKAGHKKRLNSVEDLDDIGFPCVIKPCANGSSVGVSIVEKIEDINKAIEFAMKYEDNIIIEEMVPGREFSVGVLDGKALPVIEIIPNEGFYDYKNKYQQGMAREECPARIDDGVAKKMQDLALRVHKTLQLGFYSRIDFIVNKENEPYCLEANTLPGMTPTSLLPQEAEAAGVSYTSLCERICKHALICE